MEMAALPIGPDDRNAKRNIPAFPTGLAVHAASLFFFPHRAIRVHRVPGLAFDIQMQIELRRAMERAAARVNLTKETPPVRQYVQVNVLAPPGNRTPNFRQIHQKVTRNGCLALFGAFPAERQGCATPRPF
jgi:hypothetical protein